jgi:hypothetical protein
MLAAGQVVAAIAALIIGTGPGYATAADARVYTSRTWPLSEGELPAWRVFAAGEDIISHGLNFPARHTHELTVECNGYALANTGLDAALNSLASEALTALFVSKASTALSPLNCAVVLTRIERDLETEGQAAVGRVTLSLRVRFNTYSNAPETIT